jgi:hypothetical protein
MYFKYISKIVAEMYQCNEVIKMRTRAEKIEGDNLVYKEKQKREFFKI